MRRCSSSSGLPTKEWGEGVSSARSVRPGAHAAAVCSIFRLTTSTHPWGTIVRRWLVAGVAGLLVVSALPPIADAWQVNRAGLALNRAILMISRGSEQTAGAQEAGQGSSDAAAALTGADFVPTPEAEALL